MTKRPAETGFELQVNKFRRIRRILGSDTQFVHVSELRRAGISPRVFEYAALETDMEKVPIHRVWFLSRSCDRDPLLFRVPDHFGASGKLVAKFRESPRSNYLDVGSQGRGRELEPDLIVSFAGGAMSNRRNTFSARNLHHPLGD